MDDIEISIPKTSHFSGTIGIRLRPGRAGKDPNKKKQKKKRRTPTGTVGRRHCPATEPLTDVTGGCRY